MKHKHYEMIVAKAANMDLVVFVKTCDNGAWYEKGDNSACQWWEDSDYFLCLPQHKEACLHWLNGGDVIVKDFPDDEYNERTLLSEGFSGWHDATIFMDLPTKIRIKPHKEKRWVGVNSKTGVTTHLQESREGLEKRIDGLSDYQVIEIEVEV